MTDVTFKSLIKRADLRNMIKMKKETVNKIIKAARSIIKVSPKEKGTTDDMAAKESLTAEAILSEKKSEKSGLKIDITRITALTEKSKNKILNAGFFVKEYFLSAAVRKQRIDQ